jgi:two-component system phosphate regulon response regulator PhoB
MALEGAGFQVREAGHAEACRQLLAVTSPSLLLLDWSLPGRSGLELLTELKRSRRTRQLPVIMQSPGEEVVDRIRALDAGADDCLPKPLCLGELIARIRAVLRRSARAPGIAERIEINGLCLDNRSHRVLAHGRPVALGPTEYRLLHFLMTRADRAFSREQVLSQVWGEDADVRERTVDVHILRLRKALGATGHDTLVQTVRGIGYRLSPADSMPAPAATDGQGAPGPGWAGLGALG